MRFGLLPPNDGIGTKTISYHAALQALYCRQSRLREGRPVSRTTHMKLQRRGGKDSSRLPQKVRLSGRLRKKGLELVQKRRPTIAAIRYLAFRLPSGKNIVIKSTECVTCIIAQVRTVTNMLGISEEKKEATCVTPSTF
jgi:hypothetical protein